MTFVIRDIGLTDYEQVFESMRRFTDVRSGDTPDELWLTQHHPVFTLGQAASERHILKPLSIPLVKTDRGGEVTFHAPGQLVAYLLVDIRRNKHSVHEFVRKLEQSMIDCLESFSIEAKRLRGSPGVYYQGCKIGALGLRVRKGCTYHGLALNVDMDLEPFTRIDPCGLVGMKVTQIVDHNEDARTGLVQSRLVRSIVENYGYESTTLIHRMDSWDSCSA